MTIFKNIKFIIHIVAAVLLFIFYESLVESVSFLVGGVMFLYALELLIPLFIKKEKEDLFEVLNKIAVLAIFGALMMSFGHKVFSTGCIIWGCWSIYRETSEINEIFHERKKIWVAIINIIESIVCIVFSVLLISNPTEHHALTHIILLGFELSLGVILPVLDDIQLKQ